MSEKFFGVAIVEINGNPVATLAGATINVGGVSRTDVAANGVAGNFFETPVPCEITAPVGVSAAFDLNLVRNTTNAVVKFKTDVGRNFIVKQAYIGEPPEVSDGGGGASITIRGKAADIL